VDSDSQYTPIYQVECAECGIAPVVGIRAPSGVIICSALCGPHFFGDRLMLEPERWNQQQEATE